MVSSTCPKSLPVTLELGQSLPAPFRVTVRSRASLVVRAGKQRHKTSAGARIGVHKERLDKEAQGDGQEGA